MRARKRKSKENDKPIQIYQPPITPHQLLRAIPHSNGNKSAIARRLGRSYSVVLKAINDAPDFVHEAIREERGRMGDIAEETVSEMIGQRLDFGVAARTSKWYLERKHKDRGYQPKKELRLIQSKMKMVLI